MFLSFRKEYLDTNESALVRARVCIIANAGIIIINILVIIFLHGSFRSSMLINRLSCAFAI